MLGNVLDEVMASSTEPGPLTTTWVSLLEAVLISISLSLPPGTSGAGRQPLAPTGNCGRGRQPCRARRGSLLRAQVHPIAHHSMRGSRLAGGGSSNGGRPHEGDLFHSVPGTDVLSPHALNLTEAMDCPICLCCTHDSIPPPLGSRSQC